MTDSAVNRIRLTFVLPSFAGGGAERVMLTLIRHLDRTRFTPTLVVLSGEGPLRDSVPDDLTVVDLERPRLRHAWFRLGDALRATSPDIVVPTISHINLAALMQRRRLAAGTRIVARESNTPSASLGATRWPRLYHWLYRRYCRRADAILCPSRRVSDEFAAAFGIDPVRLVTLPHPVDEDRLRGLSAAPERVPGAGLRFVAAGRLTRQKGFDRLIDAMPGLPDDTQLTIFGEGEDRTALVSRAKQRGIEDRVAFAGFSSNPWPYFAGADAFLLPSRWEGMPNAALESLAVGTPVIARSEAGGVTEIGAAPAALKIVENDQAFAAAMAGVRPRSDLKLRPSILPQRFALDSVMREFEALLSRVGAGEPLTD